MPRRLAMLTCLLVLAACGGGGETSNRTGTPPVVADTAGGAPQAAAPTAASTILEGVTRSAEHRNFLAALTAAGLDRVLAGAGPYTVFAPTDAGFAKLPASAAEGLMRPDAKARLTGLLSYHVVPGVVTAADLRSALQRKGGKTELATMEGGRLLVSQAEGGILVTDAKGGAARVTAGDMMHANGVVHAVDAVLMPR